MSDYLTLSRPAFIDLGWALIYFLWQGVLIAAALEMALVLAGRRNARLRYFLCGVALAAMPICFAVTFGQLGHEAPASASSLGATIDSGVLSGVTLPASAINEPTPEGWASEDFVLRAIPTWNWNRAMPLVVSAWLAGVVLLSGRKAGGFYLLWRWRRNGIVEPDGAMLELFERACRKIGIDPRSVHLKISELVRVPMTMGWWRPIVLFPACLLSGLSAGEIELLLAHELAHIRRWDYLVNLLQAVVETLFFHHPLTWWISHRMRQERENCCDDLVARSPDETLAYAKVLLQLETMRSPGAELVAAASGGVLRRRIERLLGDPTPGMAGGFSILLVFLFFGVVATLSILRAQTPAIQQMAAAVVITQTKELEGDVGRLYQAMVYTQTSVEVPKLSPTSWQFIADMSNNSFPVTGGTVSLPADSAWTTNPVAVVKPNLLVGAHYLFVQGFKSEADLLANFPNGKYAFDIQPGASGAAAYMVPVSFTGTVQYPPMAPVITNTTWDKGALVLDPTSAIINFTNYPGATLTWEIVIPGKTYIMSAGGGGTSVGSLNLTGMLSYGQTYQAQLRFINRDKSSTVSNPAAPKDYGYATMKAQIVEFTIKTPAGHASAVPDEQANRRVVATVNGHAITTKELKAAWESAENNLRANYAGDELKAELAKMKKKILNTLIDRWLIIDDFKKSGGLIPKSDTEERINEIIQDQYGNDRSAFLKTIGDRGLTLDAYEQQLEETAIVGYMRNKNVVLKAWDLHQTRRDLFPQDEWVNVSVMEIKGSKPVPPGQPEDVLADSDPRAADARYDLLQMRAGADTSSFVATEGVNQDEIGKPRWVTNTDFAPVPGWWPFTWDDIEKLKPGQTTDVIVKDCSYSYKDGPYQNYHYYWILRVNARQPAKMAATVAKTHQEKVLIDAEAKRMQEEWLGPLRAKAQIQVFDATVSIDPWATTAPRAVATDLHDNGSAH